MQIPTRSKSSRFFPPCARLASIPWLQSPSLVSAGPACNHLLMLSLTALEFSLQDPGRKTSMVGRKENLEYKTLLRPRPEQHLSSLFASVILLVLTTLTLLILTVYHCISTFIRCNCLILFIHSHSFKSCDQLLNASQCRSAKNLCSLCLLVLLPSLLMESSRISSSMERRELSRTCVVNANNFSIENYRPHRWTKIPTPGWEIIKDQDHGYLNPNKYQDPDIICHVGATPGKLSLTVAAGESIGLQWTTWPEGHHGNMANYLANCNGECQMVDKTKLKFNKINEEGLIHPNLSIPIGKQIDGTTTGYWAGDKVIDNGNRVDFKVPVWLKAGNYVLRHELMALHNAMAPGSGIQHIPQCINLIVTGGGNDGLDTGVLGTDLYRADQPGVVVNIFANPGTYTVPGPPVYLSHEANSYPALEKSSATPEKTSAAPEKTSAAPEQQDTSTPSYSPPTSGSPEKTSTPPEKTWTAQSPESTLPAEIQPSTTQVEYRNTSTTCTHFKATSSASLKDSSKSFLSIPSHSF
jgi:hypothetical protein